MRDQQNIAQQAQTHEQQKQIVQEMINDTVFTSMWFMYLLGLLTGGIIALIFS